MTTLDLLDLGASDIRCPASDFRHLTSGTPLDILTLRA
jgi:hypothetical protein